MYADRDDARPRKTHNELSTWLVAAGLGALVTAAAVFVASLSTGANHPAAFARWLPVASSPVLPPVLHVPTPTRYEVAPQNTTAKRSVVIESSATRAQPAPEPQERQTVFNDHNYVPRGAVNRLSSVDVMPPAAPVKRQVRAPEIVVVGRQSRVSDFCPYAAGSIEQRNCKQSVNLQMRNTPGSTR